MTPQAEPVLDLFRSTGAYLEGHFRLTSGLHSGAYLQCALVLRHPEAAERLGRMLGIAIDWQTLESFLPAGLTDPTRRRSAIASTFVAGLQLAKDGQIELRQTERFGPIHLRKRTEPR